MIGEGPVKELDSVIRNVRLDDAELPEAETLRNQIADFHVKSEQIRASDELTPSGQAKQIAPHREPVLRALGAYEGRTKVAHDDLEAKKVAIMRGDIEPTADGGFVAMRLPEPTAAEMVRYQFIWTTLRSMNTSDVRDVVLKAFEARDQELLSAIDLAPKAFPVVSDILQKELAGYRWERSGWEGTYKAGIDRIAARQYIAQKARKALGVSDN